MKATIGLGIDAGGTYTDAVLMGMDRNEVLDWAKAPTTRPDPLGGIEEALDGLDPRLLGRATLAALSSTFATNAIVENRGAPALLILVGYDGVDPARFGSVPLVRVNGGHDVDGEPKAPLDREFLQRCVGENDNVVDAYAVAGYFSVRNPEHELLAERVIREVSGKPVVCGHRLSMRLDAIVRAHTAYLNARLIPLIHGLIDSVETALERRGLRALLMVVKGDGSLMGVEMCRDRPIETILSGPAASVIGTRLLADAGEGLVVDMGGTTTDMAMLKDGMPVLSSRGALVGGWPTHVEAIEIRTIGLGGDSHVRMDPEKGVVIGPSRVIPLAVLATRHPGVIRELQRMENFRLPRGLHPDVFYLLMDGCSRNNARLTDLDQNLLEQLSHGPRPEIALVGDQVDYPRLWALERLERVGYVMRAGLTPTDILHVQGRCGLGRTEASALGLSLAARSSKMEPEMLASSILETIHRRLALEMLTHTIFRDRTAVALPGCAACERLVSRWAGDTAAEDNDYDVQFVLHRPVLAVGAPAEAYLPAVADRLGTSCHIPAHAAVANAVGAVAGSVVAQAVAHIRPGKEGGFALHTPVNRESFSSLEEALERARTVVREAAARRARENGAAEPELTLEEHAFQPQTPWGESVFIEHTITARAVGRPLSTRMPPDRTLSAYTGRKRK
ncbi:MAG: hydantoinase/oxoprolinase family protein [Deltaproteobacteria bacterium]|nr:hydantoinase/oxoprolinase family protein [Deltaproteobacteria bacterium]